MCMLYASTVGLPSKPVVAWKVMVYIDVTDSWVTSVNLASPSKSGWLRSVGDPDFAFNGLHGGAIHCFKNKKDAMHMAKYSRLRDVFKVIGHGAIAQNDREIAFKKIKFVDNLNEWEI